MNDPNAELSAIRDRYARRGSGEQYSMLRPDVLLAMQERQRALLRLLNRHVTRPLSSLRVLEIGCGSASNLLELARLGFAAENLVGNELLGERVAAARRCAPAQSRIIEGDAMQLPFGESEFDIVFQSTVFTSILDPGFRERLANRMWQWVRPGGAVLWYDFTYDNPANSDVRGVPVRAIKALFPDGAVDVLRTTLAPPIARRVTRVHPSVYHLFNVLPLLRTHVLCWIGKKESR
jgi:SAM-dependent methyltransferase